MTWINSIQAYKYDDSLLRTKYNTKQHYGWEAARVQVNSDSDRSRNVKRGAKNGIKQWQNLALKVSSGQSLQHRSNQPPMRQLEDVTGDTQLAIAFMKPYMEQLKAMADQGLSAAPPAEMMALFMR